MLMWARLICTCAIDGGQKVGCKGGEFEPGLGLQVLLTITPAAMRASLPMSHGFCYNAFSSGALQDECTKCCKVSVYKGAV